jgi:hypothetical protein
MKNTFYLNTVIYLIIIAAYIYEPLLGALCQIGLGIFQFVTAIQITNDSQRFNEKAIIFMTYYWLSAFVWLLALISSIITDYIEVHFKTILLIIPMLLGFYFVIVTYIFSKNLKL